MRNLTLTILLSFISFSLFAQHEVCGTDFTERDKEVISQFMERYHNGNFNDLKDLGDSLVPVKFHIIQNDFGFAGIDSLNVFKELDTVNAHYKGAGIKFYHCDNIDYIKNTNFVNFEKYTSEVLCDSLDILNVINIYFAPNVFKYDTDSSILNLCGYAYLSGTSMNRVILDNNCATNGSTMAHELGHYFSLLHTHTTSNGAELVDGSNCSFAGDLFCDTPADPTLSSTVVDDSCMYIGTDTDSNGDLYTPNTQNIMSYSRKSCRNHFTPEQHQAINYYLQTYRNYLHCPSTPIENIVKTNDQLSTISIYPNPTSGAFVIDGLSHTSTIQIFDCTGKLTAEIGPPTNSNTINIELATGVYFISLGSETATIIKKLIVTE